MFARQRAEVDTGDGLGAMAQGFADRRHVDRIVVGYGGPGVAGDVGGEVRRQAEHSAQHIEVAIVPAEYAFVFHGLVLRVGVE